MYVCLCATSSEWNMCAAPVNLPVCTGECEFVCVIMCTRATQALLGHTCWENEACGRELWRVRSQLLNVRGWMLTGL